MTGQLIGITSVGVTTHKTSNDDKWCTQVYANCLYWEIVAYQNVTTLPVFGLPLHLQNARNG